MVKFPTPQELEQAKEKIKPQEIILGILGVSALLTVLFVAPNIVQIIDMFGRKQTFHRKQLRDTIKRMEKRGYIRKRPSNKTCWKFALTNEGAKILKRCQIERLKIIQPQKWDGKWRLVMFDIPETRKSARHALRWKLQHLGFHYLNLSVWVFPYQCKDEINAIAEYYSVGSYVRHALVEHLDGEEELKKQFRL